MAAMVAALVSIGIALGGCDKASAGGSAGMGSAAPPASAAAKTYSSKGVIKSFGPDRKYVNLAHETIPGYMNAMTMGFEAGDSGQLAGFEVNDKVSFSFRSEDDGRHVLTRIAKEP